VHFYKSFLILFAATFLSSCGFHLRGTAPLSPPLQELYIKTADPYGQLTRNLAEYLKMSGVHLTETPEEATTVLHIISETENQQLLSVSGTQQTRQYNLTLVVTFEISNPKGVVLVPPQTLNEQRTLTTQSDQILGGSNEQNTLYQQMRQAIIDDIVNRLASRDVTTLLMEHAHEAPIPATRKTSR
jgi:LPS-assembly lipoprotein